MKGFRFITLILCIALSGSSFAQTITDVVHLKNGSVIRGVIIEQVPNESLKLQTRDGSIFVFQMSEVAKLTKEVEGNAASNSARRQSDGVGYERLGYVNHTAIGVGLGLGDYTDEVIVGGNSFERRAANQDLYLRLETVNGLWLGNGLMSLGLGVGLEYFTDIEIAQLPLFLDIRLLPLSGAVSPSIILQGGYSFGLVGLETINERILYNGPQIAGGLGLHAAVSRTNAVSVALLYDWHQFNGQFQLSGYNYELKSVGEFLRFKIGVAF